jgi:hypothetical protein
MKFLYQTRTPSSEGAQTVLEVSVGAVVGVSDVKVQTRFEEVTEHDDVGGRICQALAGFADVFT